MYAPVVLCTYMNTSCPFYYRAADRVRVNIGGEEPCNGFMIHVRGGGDAVASLLCLAERWVWYLLDCSQGEWLHHCSDADAGWQGFQALPRET